LKTYQPLEWLGDRLRLLDQTRLPHEEVYLELTDYRDVASAIKELKIRGAPAIGVAGAYGIALGALDIKSKARDSFIKKLTEVIQSITATRPTARNLFWAAERMEKIATRSKSIDRMKKVLVDEAIKIHREEIEATRKLSDFGTQLIRDGFTILTHCNTGPLATTGYGTALGIIIRAHEQGKKLRVLVSETRPLLQGARLTTWELKKAGIPFTLITDNMAGYFMSRGEVDCVVVGADRIAANGYTANKIGTYSIAVLANAHGIPFYVAAPTSTIDLSLTSGYQIPIEQRNPKEVTHIQGVAIAPAGTPVQNPAFDIIPARYITALITERGIIRKPFGEGMKEII
jgi:methylthioribose-1-phosphate isomerase